jgi:hypothetical protein
MASTYKNLTATNQVKVGAGKLKGLIVSSTTGGTLTFYDEAQGGTTRVMIGTLTPAAGSVYNFTGDEGGVGFSNGLYIVAANTINFTVFYE